MTIQDLEADLPHGFHDARLRSYSSDQGRAEFILDLCMGDFQSDVMEERERTRPARLELLGLAYLVVDAPDPRYPATDGAPLMIDACGANDDAELARRVPADGFAGRFFVTEWNAFIHFAAREARLVWLGAN